MNKKQLLSNLTGLTDNVQNQINNKANKIHKHNMSEVNDLQAKLNAKASAKHKHEVKDLTDFPTSLPANGGNADTLDGKDSSYFAEKQNPNFNGTVSIDGKLKLNGTDFLINANTNLVINGTFKYDRYGWNSQLGSASWKQNHYNNIGMGIECSISEDVSYIDNKDHAFNLEEGQRIYYSLYCNTKNITSGSVQIQLMEIGSESFVDAIDIPISSDWKDYKKEFDIKKSSKYFIRIYISDTNNICSFSKIKVELISHSQWTESDKDQSLIYKDLKQSVGNGKNRIASAITGKGISASGSDSFNTLADKINSIKSVGLNYSSTDMIFDTVSNYLSAYVQGLPPINTIYDICKMTIPFTTNGRCRVIIDDVNENPVYDKVLEKGSHTIEYIYNSQSAPFNGGVAGGFRVMNEQEIPSISITYAFGYRYTNLKGIL